MAVQLFLEDREGSLLVYHGVFPIKHQETKGNLLRQAWCQGQAVVAVRRSRASLNYNKRRVHAVFGLSSDRGVEKKGVQSLCCPGNIFRLQIVHGNPK